MHVFFVLNNYVNHFMISGPTPNQMKPLRHVVEQNLSGFDELHEFCFNFHHSWQLVIHIMPLEPDLGALEILRPNKTCLSQLSHNDCKLLYKIIAQPTET